MENYNREIEQDGNGFRLNQSGPELKSVMKFYLVVFVLLIFFGSVFQAAHFEIGMILTQVLLILLPAIWLLKRYNVNMVVFSRLNPLKLKFLPTIILLTISMWFLNMGIAVLLISGLMEFGFEPIVVLEPPQTIQEYLGYVIVLSVFAGICEEILFRGAIMPSMEKYGLVPAIVFSSFLFALFHVSFLNLISTFILGMVMAVIVIKTGSIWGGIVYHMLNNFIAATYLYIVGQQEIAADVEPGNLLELLPILTLALIGSYFGFRLLNRQSDVKPLLQRGEGFLPRGWFSLALIVAIIMFSIMAIFELAIGFGWFGLEMI